MPRFAPNHLPDRRRRKCVSAHHASAVYVRFPLDAGKEAAAVGMVADTSERGSREMPANMRYIICAALLLGGGVAAWIFRQPSLPEVTSATSFAPDPTIPRRVEGPTVVTGVPCAEAPSSLSGDNAFSGMRTIPPVDRIASQQ